MIRAHKIRLHPTSEQFEYFAKAAGTARFAFNWGLEHWIAQYEAGEKPSALNLKKQFNAIKRDEFPWVYDVTKCAVEGAFTDLGVAFKNFFEGCKSGRKVGYPKFKAKRRNTPSFYLANDKFKVRGHYLHVPKLGRVNMTEKLRFVGKILSARISKRAGWWFVSITVELPDKAILNTNPPVGIDLGINRLATLSDEAWFENQRPLKTLLKKIKRLNRRLSKKQKGGKNYEKARLKLARLHYRIACIRDDILHKMTTKIAQNYGLVGLEDLQVKGMLKNRRLSQALTDVALGRIRDLLESKVPANGGYLQKVGRFFPSSKRCHRCQHVLNGLTLSDRVFCCPSCGLECDRDWNASVNILQEATRLYEANVAVMAKTRR